MAQHGKVHIATLLKDLPPETTVGAVLAVTEGRQNFAPEKVDEIIAKIASYQGKVVHLTLEEVGGEKGLGEVRKRFLEAQATEPA